MSAEAAYLFRHAVVRDAAYQLQPPADRAALHASVVRIIEDDPLTSLIELAEHAGLARQSPQQVIDSHELQAIELNALRRGATLARKKYEHDDAIMCYRRLAEHPGVDHEEAVQARLALSDIYADNGRMDLSLAVLETLLQDGTISAPARIDATIRAAAKQHNLGNPGAADGLLKRAEELIDRHGLEQLRTQLLLTRGRSGLRHRKLEDARADLEQAIELARETDDHRSLGGALDLLSILHRIQGNYGEALRCLDAFDELVATRENAPNRVSHNSRGNVLWRQGKSDEAEREYLKALETARETGDQPDIAIATGNLGNIELDRRNYDAALRLFEAAAERCREMGLIPHTALWAMCAGNVHLYRKDYEQALELYREAERLNAQAGHLGELASVKANIGLVLQNLDRHDEAMEQFREAEQLALSVDNLTGAASHVGRRAFLHMALGQPGPARECLLRAIELMDQAGADRNANLFTWLVDLGRCELQLGNRDAARARAREARKLADELGLPMPTSRESVKEALKNLAELERALQRR